MTEKSARKTTPHIKPRRIASFSLPSKLATEVKIEATRGGILLCHLFTGLQGFYTIDNF